MKINECKRMPVTSIKITYNIDNNGNIVIRHKKTKDNIIIILYYRLSLYLRHKLMQFI